MTITSEFTCPTFIPVNGVTLEVFEAGRHNRGNPIVMCHGWPELAYSWRDQIPALVDAGYHVIVPNQRGFGNSTCPVEVTDYDITYLTGDLVGLLEHFGYDDATFVGHDWGALVVWWLAMLHPSRVNRLINLSVSYPERLEKPWIEVFQDRYGAAFYIVAFNTNPKTMAALLDKRRATFLTNTFRKNLPRDNPEAASLSANLRQTTPLGDPVMSQLDLEVILEAFEKTGFSPSIKWYRNFDRNWQILAEVDPIVRQPVLMIHGKHDPIAPTENLSDFVPNVEVVYLDCGHWIQQELPDDTTQIMLNWLARHPAQ